MKEPQRPRFVHGFIPSPISKNSLTLLLLHGTGGNEGDLIPLGQEMAPDAAIISPKGKVTENGRNRFFRRITEGVFDIEDLIFRTHELADFVEEACEIYGFSLDGLMAVGYSNGANMAASILLLRPRTLAGGILFRPMVPLFPKELPNLLGKPVLILAGSSDPLVPKQQTERLCTILKEAGARVNLSWSHRGHEIGSEEVRIAKDWLSSNFT